MESPQRSVQRSPLEQNGGAKLCLQDGAPYGSANTLSISPVSAQTLPAV